MFPVCFFETMNVSLWWDFRSLSHRSYLTYFFWIFRLPGRSTTTCCFFCTSDVASRFPGKHFTCKAFWLWISENCCLMVHNGTLTYQSSTRELRALTLLRCTIYTVSWCMIHGKRKGIGRISNVNSFGAMKVQAWSCSCPRLRCFYLSGHLKFE